MVCYCFFFFSSRRRHTRYWRDWSSDVCSSDLRVAARAMTATSQPTAMMASAPKIAGSCPPSVDCNEVARTEKSMVPPQKASLLSPLAKPEPERVERKGREPGERPLGDRQAEQLPVYLRAL